MPEMSGKCKSNPTKTNNLIYILKITQTMRKQTQKRGNLSTNWEFKLFLKTGNWPNKRGNGPKKEETDPKNEETDQQTENIQLFLKNGNRPKKRGNGPKKRANQSTNWEFETETFFENQKRTQKKRKRTQKKWKPINKLRIYNFFWKSETDPKKRGNGP